MRRAAWVIFHLAGTIAALRGERLPVHIFTTTDGLAHNIVDRIVQDSRGFLWFCTREGLSRFDGYQFTNFGADQGLPGSVNDLIETPGGLYWVATSRGLAHFRAASSQPRFEISLAGNPAHSVIALARDPAGGIWAGTSLGLYHVADTQAWESRAVDLGQPPASGEDARVHALLVDRAGTLWVGTTSGLYRRYPDGRSEHIHDALPGAVVDALLQDRQGRLWVGTTLGLCRVSVNSPLTPSSIEKKYLPGLPVNSLFESSGGQLYVGTDRGLQVALNPAGHGQAFASYTAANGLGGGQVQAIAQDRAGNLWLGSAGANRIAKGGLVTYGAPDGLDSSFVLSIGEDRTGSLFAVTESQRGKLVNRFDGRAFHPVRPHIPDGILDWGWGTGQITFQDRDGKWWVPTSDGVFVFSVLSAAARPSAVYLEHCSVYRVFQDSHGDVWISAQVHGGPHRNVVANRLARWERSSGRLHDYVMADPTLATAFAEDPEGDLWMGLSSGSLARYRQGRFDFFDQAGAWTNALHASRDGRIWAGTSQGLIRIDQPSGDHPVMAHYTTAQGLSSNAIRCITEDRWGRLYLGTGRGVDSLSRGDPLRIRRYTTAEGLANGELSAAFRDRQGVLWFATKEGISRLDPLPEGLPSRPPVLLSAWRVRGVPRPVSMLGESALSAITLTPEQNQVEFEFVGLGFAAGEAMRYQYRLSGDQDWSPATGQRTVNYANLGPGDYRWQVRAVAADGSVSERPATVAFLILPPLWQRWWLRLLLLTLACALLYTLHRYRLDRYLEVERLRSRIATDLHDDIGSTLSQIAILSEVAHRDHSRNGFADPLADIADMSRELIDSMSDIVWAIDPEQDSLGDVTRRMRRFAGDLFNPYGVPVSFHAPDDPNGRHMGSDLRRQLFLIFKESLHNVARHSNCTAVAIEFRLSESYFDLLVSDNGKGFDAAQVRRGHGLLSIERRARQLNGSIVVSSTPGRGTSVCLRVPSRPSVSPWRRILHQCVGENSPLRRMLRRERSR